MVAPAPTTAAVHPWKLVAPWWRWRRQMADGSAASPRETRPTIQKFSDPAFVETFLKDPQRSLKFDDAVDQVFLAHLVPTPPLSAGPLINKAITLFAPRRADGTIDPQTASLVPQGIRKLFLHSHRRFYAVVCELHCDFAGFPSPNVDETCEMGFVVRRRVLRYPKKLEQAAAALLREIVAAEARVAELDETAPARPAVERKRAAMVAKMKSDGTFASARAAAGGELATKRAKLESWLASNGVLSVLEGWIPSALPRIGAWGPVEETPTTTVIEAAFPMHRLAGDPSVPAHDATGRAVWFGVVPTAAFETEGSGQTRFDDQSAYEIRCFVRRHDHDCPKRPRKPDCDGELVWSRPTDIYRLAPHHDLVGTSNHPVTIQMPDLAELAAQASSLPFGRFSPVKVVHKQSMQTKMSGKTIASGSIGGAAICFFSIPLITIVAMFVLQIFLPIVMLIFGLWFLVAFRFCIPPSFSVNLGVQASLTAIVNKPVIDVDADFSVTLPDLSVETSLDINTKIRSSLVGELQLTTGLEAGDLTSGLESLANTPLIQLARVNAAIGSVPAGASSVGLDLSSGQHWEDRESMMVLR